MTGFIVFHDAVFSISNIVYCLVTEIKDGKRKGTYRMIVQMSDDKSIEFYHDTEKEATDMLHEFCSVLASADPPPTVPLASLVRGATRSETT